MEQQLKKYHTSDAMLLAILGAMMMINSLSTDVFLPAMPEMEQDLGSGVEMTVSSYLLGYVIAQLAWGPISDMIGRRKPIVIGSIMFVIGSVGCGFATSLPEMIAWRIFQAVGACAGPLLSRAMIRDLYDMKQGAEKLSTLTVIMSIAPILGPMMGAAIGEWASWHYIFYATAAIGLVIGAGAFLLPESLPKEQRLKRENISLWGIYKDLFQNANFMKYTLCIAFFYMAIYAVVAGSSFMYIDYYHVSPSLYSILFGLNIVGVMIVSFFNRQLVRRHSMDSLLKFSGIFSLFWATMILVMIYTDLLGVTGVVISLASMFSMNGMIVACATAAALEAAGKNAGSAAGLLGSFQYGSGIISSALLAALPNDTPYPMSFIIWIAIIGCAVCAVIPQKTVKK